MMSLRQSKRSCTDSFLMGRFDVAFILMLGCFGLAQTNVSGVVVDENNQPIPFVNVYFPNSSEGTISDEKGQFKLNSKNNHQQLVISLVGYKINTIDLSKSNTKQLRIVLKEGEELDEVVIISKPKKHLKKKENPAYTVLQKIWDSKDRNQLKHLNSYQAKVYEMLEVDLNQLDTVFLKKLTGDSYDSLVAILRKRYQQDWFEVPIFLKEQFEMLYVNNQLKKEKRDKFAERITGIAPEGIAFDKLTAAFQEFDLYDNNLKIVEKHFVSPVSKEGYNLYEYLLQDSIVVDDKKFYKIYFFPRQEGDLVFKGSFLVDTSNYGISEIEMQLGGNTNLNMVRSMVIKKEYELIDDTYVIKQTDFLGDFTLFSNAENEKGVTITKRLVYLDYIFDEPKEPAFYDKISLQKTANQYEKDDAFWEENAVMSDYVVKSHQIILELRNNKKIKALNNALSLITTGNIPIFEGFQLGSLWVAVNRNDVEGTRIRLGLRNYTSKDDRLRINTYVAWGTLDKDWKYGGEVKYLIGQEPRVTVGVSYMDDFEQISAKVFDDTELLVRNFGVGALFVRGVNISLTHNRRFSSEVRYEFNQNLHLSVAGIYQDMQSAAPDAFSLGYLDANGNIQIRVQHYSSSATLTYTPGRLIYGFGVERKFSKKNFATYRLRFTKGFSGITNTDFDYHQLRASVTKTYQLGMFGFLNSYIEGSKLFGQVPLALMTPIHANQTYSVVNSTFSLLSYYDLVTDQYVMGQFDYHLNGLLFNRIPLIKKLKLREVAFYRAVMGSFRPENQAISLSNIPYIAPDVRPYQEFGFGVENIGYGNFRPLRVDFTWRNNFQFQNPHNQTPKFGVLLGVKADF